jgi:hypothetical protein
MKLLLTGLFLFSVVAQAKVTLRVPIFVEGIKKNPISMRVVNADLRRQGKDTLPEVMFFTQGVEFDYWKFSHDIEEKLQKAGYKSASMAFEGVPAEYSDRNSRTCFKGEGARVADFAASLADGPYSDQLTMLGWKYQSEKWVNDENDDEAGATEKVLGEESKEWRNYDKSSDVVLILSAISDDGTDVNESVIPRCPNSKE